ncbi:MAG: threonine synthase [Deltaproteobacteria bacterium]|nr:threonine synthase [Deltaproteobacteria bacterium]
MKISQLPEDIQKYIIPTPNGTMLYRCLGCNNHFGIDELLYTCPDCGTVLMLEDSSFDRYKDISGEMWRRIFDYRSMICDPPLKGIFRFYEFIAPIIPLDKIVYLGEGHTPVVKANNRLRDIVGRDFFFKDDGLNPSASFKDRGMACAMSYINYFASKNNAGNILAICASTGDTSAAAALYASYMGAFLKSAVILPQGKVTPQQLAQPLGAGAKVMEIPGVFDDCMKVVEALAENYHVALLNSKNSWRILGQESYSYEIAQAFDYEVGDKVIVLPVGNAGNITAVMSGFLKFYRAGVIKSLPKIIGVQSEHADPVYRYYLEGNPDKRVFRPVNVKASVAQAAMIGNPVSMPRVIEVANAYNSIAPEKKVFVVQVREQEIMDSMIMANRNGNVVCTQGGESMAGMKRAVELGIVKKDETGILDSTAHMLKFLSFQEKYFNDSFEPEFNVKPVQRLKNFPMLVKPSTLGKFPAPGNPLTGKEMDEFVTRMSTEIAGILDLEKR